MNGAELTGADEHQRFMRAALQMAERGMAAGGPPVGACLVRDGVIISRAQNAVVADLDITAHAEIVAIRTACREQRTLSLESSTLYVTVEPCAMCMAASFYAGIGHIVFGADIAEMQARTGAELGAGSNAGSDTAASDFFANVAGMPGMTGGVLDEECRALLDAWRPLA